MSPNKVLMVCLVAINLAFTPLQSIAQSTWNLTHPEGRPVGTPDAGKRLELKNSIVDRVISKKKSGFLSDKGIILGTRKQFDLDSKDKDRLRAAGFEDDVIADIEAKGKWRHVKKPQPLKGTTIRQNDSLFHNLVTANKDKVLRAELINVWEGLCHIDFINQTDHFVDLHYLTFDKGTRNVNFVSDLRHNDNDSMASNVLYVRQHNSKGRYGQGLSNFYNKRIFPHPDNTDKSRYDIWKQENTFVGQSTAFTDSKFQTPPANPASIMRVGDFTHHYSVHAESALDPKPMTVDSFYCYSYRDEMDNLQSKCSTLKGTCNTGRKEKPKFELGITANVDIKGPSIELGTLPFNLPRNIAKDGLGSGLYKTNLVTYKWDKDKAGKEHIFVYMLDTDPAHNPREKFYASLRLYPETQDLLGHYEFTENSDNRIWGGILISEFHFSNHEKIRGQSMGKLNIDTGYAEILSVTDEAIFGTIYMKADYTYKILPDYNKDDDCHPGLEDESVCNPVFQINISNAKFGAKKR